MIFAQWDVGCSPKTRSFAPCWKGCTAASRLLAIVAEHHVTAEVPVRYPGLSVFRRQHALRHAHAWCAARIANPVPFVAHEREYDYCLKMATYILRAALREKWW